MTVTRMQSVKFAKHSSTTAFDAASIGTAYFLEPESVDAYPRDTERIERETYRADGAARPEVRGRKMLDPIALDLRMRGFAANTGAALTASTGTEVGQPLDVISGGAATDPSGSATTIASGSSGGNSITVASDSDVAVGVGVLILLDDGSVVAREVTAKPGSAALTLDRDIPDDVDGDDPSLIRSSYWTFSPSVTKHTHGHFIVEGQDWARTYSGCMSDGTIRVEEGQTAILSTSWLPSTWADLAEPNATFSAPSAGADILGVNSSLWIGDDKLLVKGVELSFGHTIVPRGTVNASDGVHGYVVTQKRPVLRCRCYFDPGGISFGALEDSTGNFSLNKAGFLTNSSGSATSAGQAVSTYDVALQVGNFATGCMYVRLPAATARGRMVDDNGLECVDLEFHARAPASGTPMRLHLF